MDLNSLVGAALAGAGVALAKRAHVTSGAALDRVAAATNKNPTPKQAETGLYLKARCRIHGLDIAIENARGSWRRKFNADGSLRWKCKAPAHYGYIERTVGADGDAVDCYIGSHLSSPKAFVIDQHFSSGDFDEHKLVLAVRTEEDAIRIYDAGFADGSGPRRRRAVRELTYPALKEWLDSGKTKEPIGEVLQKAAGDGRRKTLDQVIAEVEKSVAKRVAETLAWLKGTPSNDMADSAQYRHGDITADAMPRAELEQRLDRAVKPLDQAWMGGGRDATRIPETGEGDKRVAFQFDAGNPTVLEALDGYKLGLIREISDGQRDTIRAIVSDGLARGLPPAKMAQAIRDSVGLTEIQAGHVASYRAELESSDVRLRTKALTRALRDRRFDPTVISSVGKGETLGAEQVDKMVDAYQRRYIALRAMTIARTEALRAASLGSFASIDAAAASGNLDNFEVVKTWIATGDGKTRPTHWDLNGKSVIGLDTPFVTAAGARLLHPHDISAPAAETINCRCTLKFSFLPKRSNSGEPIALIAE